MGANDAADALGLLLLPLLLSFEDGGCSDSGLGAEDDEDDFEELAFTEVGLG